MVRMRSANALKKLFLGALGVSALAIGPVQAAPLLVTFDPGAIPGVSGVGTFQADNYNLSDFAVATITNATGQFTETGTLQLLTFLNGSTTLGAGTSGLRNGTGAGSYGLYMTFTATGYVGVGGGPFVPGSSLNQGFFQTVTYTLHADPGNTDTVSSTGVLTDNGTADVTLATGGLAGSGVNQVSVNVTTPSADVLLSIAKSALGDGFFQSPADLAFQEDAFTNTTLVATVTSDGITTTVAINGGGGNGTFLAAVPEPSSLLLLGMGAMTLAVRARARRRA
jgi:hypothetical protein